ncbi:uncharacterized protein LOC132605892 [Lycium barbarum]|uniref:uncharacterized protein LOC132605892 n=1 Tax=Lycium barbarum TaxID=112863 RepID=UPI00293E36ED|nr:uncharacterized protein LOC132605892 [Lycium barbarum]XP_060175149.1 uncharacterized protein LOC132605892 [Lycium barbarum]XP_060175150.1 uncharacterized protein LOC132605892 [Lycium barbarum]
MSDPTASISTGVENIVISSDPPETSEHGTAIQRDEHIARLTQEIENLRGELNRVRDLTNLSITLQSPPSEPTNTAPDPPRFPSLESPVPEHFPPRNNAPTNNNLPPITPANPPNPTSVYTPPQSQPTTYTNYTSPQNQPPTYTTYATPNPPPVNPPNQSLVHTPYVPLPTNTNPPPTTTPLNPPNQPPTNTTYNTPPPVQNTPTIQTYPTQHLQGAHIVTPNAQYVPPVYATETQAFTNPVTVRFQPEVDQYEEMEKDAKAGADNILLKEIHSLKEAMRNLQVARGTKSVEYEDLCVQPDVDLPVGYKPPKFDTFNGTGDPHTHLRAYCDKLVGVGRDQNIRMKLFIRSLSGEALTWYTQQDVRKWRGWSDMAQDFMDRFSFNTDITPDRVYMTKLTKKVAETFREYALRWRSEAARVQPPMNDREMTATFIECQAGIFYEKMIGMMGQKFTEVVRMGEALEEGIKSGKIQDLIALQAINKAIQSGSINGVKKKKEDVTAVMNIQRHEPSQAIPYLSHPQQPFYPYHYPEPYQAPLSPYPVYNTQANYYQPRAPPHQNPRPYKPNQAPTYQNRPHTIPRAHPNPDTKNTRNYTRIAEPLAQLFERMKAAGIIQPIEGKIPEPIPKWFDGSKRCAYHSGVVGHATEDCYGLKNKIEALIKEGVIQLAEAKPNVVNNPLPAHEDAKF